MPSNDQPINNPGDDGEKANSVANTGVQKEVGDNNGNAKISKRLNPTGRFYRLSPIEIFTGVLCVVGALQWWAFVQSERAFVFPSNVAFVDSLDSILIVMPLDLKIELENSGRSPASIYKLTLAITIDELPPEPPDYTHGIDHAQFAFPPIPVNQKISQVMSFPFWETKIARAVGSGDKNFFVIGRIDYGDDYWIWPNRRSDFCFRYIADRLNHSKSHFRVCTNPKYTKTN